MVFTPEQIASTHKAGVETFLGLASSQFAAFERLSTLNFNAAKGAFEETLGRTKALLDAKDAQEYVNLGAAASQPVWEKAVAYSRGLYEVVAQAQGEVAKFVEGRAAEFSKNLAEVLDKLSKNAPAGSDFAVAAMRSALAATSTAYDSLNKVAKQATEIAEANFNAPKAPAKEKKQAAA